MSAATHPVIIPPDLLVLIPPKYRAAATVGNSEAEVERWKAERRRNFPTEELISRKRARASAVEESGHLLEAHPTGMMRRANNALQRPKKVVRVAKVPREDGPPGVDDEEEEEEEVEEAEEDGPPEELPVGREALALQGSSLEQTGEEDTRLGVVRAAAEAAAASSGAGSGSGSGSGSGEAAALPRDTRPLCAVFKAKGHCRYGSSCRFSHSSAGTAQPTPGSLPTVCRWYLLGVCTAGKRCPYQHAQAGKGGGGNGGSGAAGGGGGSGAAGGGGSEESNGLLRRLLARDVQREASMLLQSIRYLVRHQCNSNPPTGASATIATTTDDATATAAADGGDGE